MCAIAGVFNFDRSLDLSGLVKKMTDSMLHRGPDGEGLWVNDANNLGLGHRRLSIIDLSKAGNQPMHFADRYTIVFNGEIYNYVEIKTILIKKGYKFLSNSDTEVLLALFHEEKENSLHFLDGMFSFVIYDSLENSIFAARDRFGEKPFYYTENNDNLFFASEIKAFWSVSLEKKVDNEMLFYYLSYSQMHHPFDCSRTFFQNIFKLKPGCYFKINLSKKEKVKQIQYWNLPSNRSEIYDKWSRVDITEKFIQLFEESVFRRLRSDVPIGSSLSGGLDSSLIVCVINQLKKNVSIRQSTFSAKFPGFSKDESYYIDSVVNHINASSFFTFPDKEGFIANLDKIFFHQDEPFTSASIYAQYDVMRLAKENNITVLLDGQGADEILAGYLYYRDSVSSSFFPKFPNSGVNEPKKHLTLSISRPFLKRNFRSFIKVVKKYNDLRIKMNFNGSFNNDFLDVVSKLNLPYIYHPSLYSHLKHDVVNGNLEDLLRYADRNSMAHSREVRLPFLSHEFVEFSMSLPETYKINGIWSKYIQRVAFEKILPHDIVWRKDKIGYEPPQKKWMEDKRIVERIMESKKNLYSNHIISRIEAEKKPSTTIANEKGDNSWNYLMTSILF